MKIFNKKVFLITLFILFFLVAAIFIYSHFKRKIQFSEVRISILDNKTLAVAVNVDDFLQARLNDEKFVKLILWNTIKLPLRSWTESYHYYCAMAEIMIKYRPEIFNLLQDYEKYQLDSDSGNILIIGGSFWQNALGQLRIKKLFSDVEFMSNHPSMGYYVYLPLFEPLKNGGAYQLTLPDGEKFKFKYDDKNTVSALFKLNQVGFSIRANRKYAYLGGFLGDGGALNLSRFAGKTFNVVDENSMQTVFQGKIVKRVAKDMAADGEDVYELDLSDFKTPGRYHLQIDEIGRSLTFQISDDAIGEAFFIHARGLYHKRCGIAKAPPFSNWPSGKCHTTARIGNFPPNNRDYQIKKGRLSGFFDSAGNPVEVDHFKLIQQNCQDWTQEVSAVGGWHDAADYDRRPYHFRVVGDLLGAYLLKPDNFSDGQLNIPESGNGIPDILDEALWGMNFYLSLQKSDGSVPTWVESTSHPGEWIPEKDQSAYYISMATCESSLEYSAYAAMTALVLQSVAPELSRKFLCSAEAAFDFAVNPLNRRSATFSYEINGTRQLISYRENPENSAKFLVKAAMDLYFLTGKNRYIELVKKNISNSSHVVRRAAEESEWFLIELAAIEKFRLVFPQIYRSYAELTIKSAQDFFVMLDFNHSYRIPWYLSSDSKVQAMAWGNVHPLVQAKLFLAAWKLSGNSKFLDAAFLCNDYHNGGNPLNLSMTSNLGQIYPVKFLDLVSCADSVAEFVPGITPYRFTYKLNWRAAALIHGLFYSPNIFHFFPGAKKILLPKNLSGSPGNIDELLKILMDSYPLWRRFTNMEGLTVKQSEYTVNETISPAAATTGVLMTPGFLPDYKLKNRHPVENIKNLGGYLPLP